MVNVKLSEEYIASLRRNDGLWQMSVIDLQYNLLDARLELADALEYLSKVVARRKSKL